LDCLADVVQGVDTGFLDALILMSRVLSKTLNDLSLPDVLRELIRKENLGYQLGSRLLDFLIVLDDEIEGCIIKLLLNLVVNQVPSWLGTDETQLGTNHLDHGYDYDLS
jgi:hypothetical protein